MKQIIKEPIPYVLKPSQGLKTRHVLNASEIQKLANNNEPVVLYIIKPTNEVTQ